MTGFDTGAAVAGAAILWHSPSESASDLGHSALGFKRLPNRSVRGCRLARSGAHAWPAGVPVFQTSFEHEIDLDAFAAESRTRASRQGSPLRPPATDPLPRRRTYLRYRVWAVARRVYSLLSHGWPEGSRQYPNLDTNRYLWLQVPPASSAEGGFRQILRRLQGQLCFRCAAHEQAITRRAMRLA